jgi:hypothetical protein
LQTISAQPEQFCMSAVPGVQTSCAQLPPDALDEGPGPVVVPVPPLPWPGPVAEWVRTPPLPPAPPLVVLVVVLEHAPAAATAPPAIATKRFTHRAFIRPS